MVGRFLVLQIQIKQKSQFEFVPQDTSEFKSNQNFTLTLYREIPRNLIFSILTSSLKSPHHSGFRLPFNSAFRVSTSTERAVQITSMSRCALSELKTHSRDNNGRGIHIEAQFVEASDALVHNHFRAFRILSRTLSKITNSIKYRKHIIIMSGREMNGWCRERICVSRTLWPEYTKTVS